MAVGYFGLYQGTVIRSADPEVRGRLILQVPSVTGFRQTNWAESSHPAGFPALAPKPGDQVWVQFEGGDAMRPVWTGIPGASSFAGGVPGAVTLDSLTVTGDLALGGTLTSGIVPWARLSGVPIYALDNTVVHLTGNESVSGTKTFTANASFNGAPIGNGNTNGFYYDGNVALRGVEHYFQAGSAGTNATRGRWTSSGLRIGDGVLAASPLDVSGDIRFSGTMQAGTVPWARLSGTPTNLVTTDTAQTLTGAKTFSAPVIVSNTLTATNVVYGVTASGNLASSGGQNPALSMTTTPTFTSATVPTLTGLVNTTGNLSENGQRVYSASNVQPWATLSGRPAWLAAVNLSDGIPSGDINLLGNQVSGFYNGSDTTNNPLNNGDWWNILNLRHSNATNNYGFQLASRMTGGEGYWIRKYEGGAGTDASPGTFNPWRRIYTEEFPPATPSQATVLHTIASPTSAYSVAAGVSVVLASGTFTVTLPAASSNTGRGINVKSIGTGTITVASAGGTIDTAATAVISTKFTSITVVSNGADWFII